MVNPLDALTLDQLRLFVCVAREGSFSAAARRLHRAQSAVSYGVARLERLLGVRLFDRSGRRPALTEAGRAFLADAHQVLDAVRRLHARAAGLAEGLEPEVRLAVDAICPMELLVELGRAFQERFPTVALHIRTEVLGAVPSLVLDGTCRIGIAGTVEPDVPGLERRFLTGIPMAPVAAATHPLAALDGPVPSARLRAHVKVVIAERTEAADGRDRSTASGTTWRVADTATKLGLIRAELGWGFLPLDAIRDDLERGALVRLELEGEAPMRPSLYAITRSDAPPGPAGQWLLRRLGELCGEGT